MGFCNWDILGLVILAVLVVAYVACHHKQTMVKRELENELAQIYTTKK